jgi:beta-lactamase regulating signal transducer with metallopeptidase domain
MSETLLSAGLLNAAAAALLAIVILIVSRFCRNPAVVHALWLLVLLKLVTPPLISVPLSTWDIGRAAGPFAFTSKAVTSLAVGAPASRMERAAPPAVADRAGEAIPSANETSDGTVPAQLTAGGASDTPSRAGANATWSNPSVLVRLLLGVWISGAVFAAFVILRRIVRFHRALGAAKSAPDWINELLTKTAATLGYSGAIRVRIAAGNLPPLVWPIGRPTLLFSQSALEKLGREEIETLIAHEVAHLLRRDHCVRWVELVIGCLYWWYPLVWWLRRRLTVAEEEACDAWVVSRLTGCAKTYATALVKVTDLVSAARPNVPQLASGIGVYHPLTRRIQAMLTATSNPRLSTFTSAVIVLLGAVVLPLSVHSVAAASEEAPTAEAGPEHEVHAVGVYEGATETGNQIHGPRADIELDRPGKEVTLVLTSYEPITWRLSVGEETNLTKVILGGNKLQAVEGITTDVEIVQPEAERSQRLPVVRSSETAEFRYFVEQVRAITGRELSSFHGIYRPEATIEIDSVQDNLRLSSQWPQPTPLRELPEAARELTFEAHSYTTVRRRSNGYGGGYRGGPQNAAYGTFTLEGPVPEELVPLPGNVERVAYDPRGERYYGIAGHDVAKVDLEEQEVERMTVGLDVPPLSWPAEVTFDTKRRRLILGTSGGGGYLYAYSPETEEWSVISKRPGAFDAYGYSEEDDLLYGILFSRGPEDGLESVTLAKVNANGALLETVPIKGPIVPGSLTRGPGVSTTRVIPVQGFVVIIGKLGDRHSGAPEGESFIYLVDPETGQVWLTAKGNF